VREPVASGGSQTRGHLNIQLKSCQDESAADSTSSARWTRLDQVDGSAAWGTMAARMLVFGHLGFGHQLVAPWHRRLPAWPLAIGMLLPDLIDKPLYYAGISDFITSTRTFGHTGLLCLAMFGLSYLLRKRILTALALGMATHLLLDFVMDRLSGNGPSSTLIAVAWPLRGWQFAVYDHMTFEAFVGSLLNPLVIVTEILGMGLLAWALWRVRRPLTS
jgi:hypothetical protein